MVDYAVVGSGIGGSSIATYLHSRGHGVKLFEKEPYLGGCSSTFSHQGYRYNSGATTFAGYQEGYPVKRFFDAIGHTPLLIESNPAMVVIHHDKETPRYRELDRFLFHIERNYPHRGHRIFWEEVYRMNALFYPMKGYYYDGSSLWKKLQSSTSYRSLFWKFKGLLQGSALDFIRQIYGEISQEYYHFLSAQVLIASQATLEEINPFTAMLALGYSFQKTHYVVGGMSHLFDRMTAPLQGVQRESEITKIKRMHDRYILQSTQGEVEAKSIIMNSTIYQSTHLFEDTQIKSYYNKYSHLNNYQSSFMLYMTLKSSRRYEHHYQIIQPDKFPHTLSNALFVSFSDISDNLLSREGLYSVTASIHTDLRWWQDDASYEKQKQSLGQSLLQTICAILSIDKNQIVHHVCATPRTFGEYINRTQLGGNAMTKQNFFLKLPSNNTPINGLYHVGDSVYAGQGWTGVMLGVQNLARILNAPY
jgi:phytoene dehydrogenase-like protein